MRLLIWAQAMSVGGGMRLLGKLAAAIARQEDMELVRLVVADAAGVRARMPDLHRPNIEVVEFGGSIQEDAGRRLYDDCHIVYYFWPHMHPYRPIPRPTVCTFHDATILDYVPPFLTGTQIRDYWAQSRQWLENCTMVVVSSEHVKRRIIEHFGGGLQAAVVIPHAILPADPVRSRPVSPGLAGRLPAKYMVYPSNTSPHKNHHNLLLGYAKFSKRAKYPLVLIGSLTEELRKQPPNWPEYATLPTLVSLMKREGLRIDADVYPLGFVADSDAMAVIERAYALVMPSLSEGGGSYPVEEALRLGVPVLCSDIPVMREHLSRHTAKVVWFDPTSPLSIADALEEMVSRYSVYKKSALQGMSDPTDTWDDIAKQYIHAFRLSYLKYYT